jgi:pimeloyl-ACP methyl ester carboxylesterase
VDVNPTTDAQVVDTGDNMRAIRRLRTEDGVTVRVEAFPAQSDGDADLVFVVVPGFTQSSRSARLRQIVEWLRPYGGVVQVDLRGHGGSGGSSSVGDVEVLDVDAAVRFARSLGYRRVVTVGFSLGAAVSLRHAALHGGVAAVAAVSGPGEWFYRGTASMRWLHHGVGTVPGRAVLRYMRRTKVQGHAWAEPYPLDPPGAAARVTVPVLVVHGDRDDFFPLHHAWRIHRAGPTTTLWVEEGFGHAESHVTPDLMTRIAAWLVEASAAAPEDEASEHDTSGRDTTGDGR